MRSPPSSAAAVVELKRGPWTAEEDKLLSDYIKKQGEGKWRTLPTRAGLLRCGKSCRLRWMNYLRPSVKRGHITSDEEDLIIRLHRLLGNRWSLIAGRIPGRTDNEIKNYWNTHLSKKLMSHGIDPKTHKPLLSIAKPPNPDSCGVDDRLLLDSSTETLLPTSNDERTSCNIEAAAFQEKDSHCPDDTFSAFVNSFINDDMFESHQQEKKTTAS